MKILVVSGILLAVISFSSGAQVYSDSFNYPDGTTVPGWNESVGDWSIKNKQLASEHKFLWEYIVLDAFSELNACVEVTVITTLSTSFYQCGGCTQRYSTASNVMCKIQDNNRNGDLDMCYVYDRPGSATSSPISPVTKQGRVRFFTLDKDLICQVDSDMNGVWDLVVVRQTTLVPTAGKPGIHALGGTLFDDFEYFNAVARIHPNSQTPTVGGLVTFQLKGPGSKFYQCACSFGNGGFQVDKGRRIPLTLDDLMVLSMLNPALFQTFSGTLGNTGDGLASVLIPKIPALSGQTFYFAFVALDPAAPGTISHISNEVRVDIS